MILMFLFILCKNLSAFRFPLKTFCVYRQILLFDIISPFQTGRYETLKVKKKLINVFLIILPRDVVTSLSIILIPQEYVTRSW